MPPLRLRDVRLRSTSPLIQRRIARGLSIDVSLANDIESEEAISAITCAGAQEMELALAAKEVELYSLLSPIQQGSRPPRDCFVKKAYSGFRFFFPRVIDSQSSFLGMRQGFMSYLAQIEMLNLVPESKLYHSIYFPYG